MQISVIKPLIVFIAVMGLLFSAGSPSTYASATITLDSAASTSCGSTPCTDTLTWSHTIGSGANRILIVGVSGQFLSAPITSIVYGSSSLTPIAAQNDPFSSVRADAWYLLNPPTGTASIIVTFSSSPIAVVGGSASYFNVAKVGGFNSANGGTQPATVVVNSNAGDLVTDVLAMFPGPPSLASAGADQTVRWNILALSGAPEGAGSDKQASSPTTTMTWSGSGPWALIGIQLQPTLCVSTAAGGATACAVTDFGILSSFSAVSAGSITPAPPSELTFPYGLFSITVSRLEPGQTITVTITLSSPLQAGEFSYWKFHGGTWTQFASASLDSTRTVITLTLTSDPTGTVNDPGGPAIPAPPPPVLQPLPPIPVGGEMVPISRVQVMLPWLALIAGLSILSAAILTRRRRTRDN